MDSKSSGDQNLSEYQDGHGLQEPLDQLALVLDHSPAMNEATIVGLFAHYLLLNGVDPASLRIDGKPEHGDVVYCDLAFTLEGSLFKLEAKHFRRKHGATTSNAGRLLEDMMRLRLIRAQLKCECLLLHSYDPSPEECVTGAKWYEQLLGGEREFHLNAADLNKTSAAKLKRPILDSIFNCRVSTIQATNGSRRLFLTQLLDS